jgi:vesicular inhibitory amino acid transporter
MLAMPLGLAFAGWGMGIALIIFYGSISCYTYAPTLDAFTSHSRASQCQNTGRNNFVGSASTILRRHWTESLWATLHSCHQHTLLPGIVRGQVRPQIGPVYRNSLIVSVILVTLYADSLNSLIPQYSSNTYKLWGIFMCAISPPPPAFFAHFLAV